MERQFVRLNIYLVVLPFLFAFGFLGILFPPIAVALLYSANPLLAQVSIGNPGLSFLPILTGTLIFVLLLRRWNDGGVAAMCRARVFQWIPFFLLLVFLLHGSIRSQFWGSSFSLNNEGLGLTLGNALDAYHPLHYIYFISIHWLSFLILGILACASLGDMKIFFLSLPMFIVGPLLGIPALVYVENFGEVLGRGGMETMIGLTYANINRGFVGYLAAIGVLVSVTRLNHLPKSKKSFGLAFLGISLLLIILSGSKGPVFGCVLGLCLMLMLSEKRGLLKGLLLSVGAVGLTALLSYALGFNGILNQFFLSSHSFTTRLNLMSEALNQFATGNIGIWLLGGGFGSSTLQLPNGLGPPYVHMGSHNLFLDLLNEVGILGLIWVLGSILFAGQNFYREIKNHPPGTQKYFESLLCAIGGVIFVKLSVGTDTYGEDILPLVIGVLTGSSICIHLRRLGK
ncbi:MAG: O-antigen ligase family protein [bacterium]|nr:O-antigen ligase family protein [bacterium]